MAKPSFITDLIAHAGAYGFQKSNKFIVFINGPSDKPQTPGKSRDNQIGLMYDAKAINRIQRLALTCVDASLPGRLISTEDVRTYNLATKMPNYETFSQQLTLTFMCSTDMYEKMYFKFWQDKVINPITHSPQFYQDYAKPFTITILVLPDNVNSFNQLGNPLTIATNTGNDTIDPTPFDEESLDTNGVYFIKCLECYPLEIADLPLSSSNPEIMRMSVTFAFRKWIDPVELFMINQKQKAVSQAAQRVLDQDPDQIAVDSFDTPYADRGQVLNQRQIDLTEDRVGPQTTIDPPWMKFIKYARDAVRLANPKELRQVLVDSGLNILGSEFGVSNVEHVAQAGQIIDVFLKNPDYSYEGLRSRLLKPISDIGNFTQDTTITDRLSGIRF